MAHSNFLPSQDFRVQPIDVALHHKLRPVHVLVFDARALFLEDHFVASYIQTSDTIWNRLITTSHMFSAVVECWTSQRICFAPRCSILWSMPTHVNTLSGWLMVGIHDAKLLSRSANTWGSEHDN